LIKVLTGKSGDAVNWLQDSFGLDLSKVSRLGGHSQPRTHRGGAQVSTEREREREKMGRNMSWEIEELEKGKRGKEEKERGRAVT